MEMKLIFRINDHLRSSSHRRPNNSALVSEDGSVEKPSSKGSNKTIPSQRGASARKTRVIKQLAFDISRVPKASLAEKLRRPSLHWTRHTHATHALARDAELTTVRDNLHHAPIATTSIDLLSDEAKRSRQMDEAFGAP